MNQESEKEKNAILFIHAKARRCSETSMTRQTSRIDARNKIRFIPVGAEQDSYRKNSIDHV